VKPWATRLALAGVALAAAPGRAAEPPATVSELVITASKTVSELLVTGRMRCLAPDYGAAAGKTPPKVVSAFPARGAEVRPGLLVVRVTFDQPMTCAGRFDPTPALADPCPGQVRDMLLSYDRRTVRTVCMVEPGVQYGLSLGEDPNSPTAFLGLAGLPAAPARLNFTTSAGPVISDVCEALSQDPVTAADLARRGKTCPEPR